MPPRGGFGGRPGVYAHPGFYGGPGFYPHPGFYPQPYYHPYYWGPGPMLGVGLAAGALAGAAITMHYHHCPSCGSEVSNLARFCPWCRAPQDPVVYAPPAGPMAPGGPAQANVALTVNCPQCSAPAVAGAPYCPHCSADLPANECPNCQSPFAPGAKFCSECGKALPQSAAAPAAAAPVAPPSP